jgi:hypothetical protein
MSASLCYELISSAERETHTHARTHARYVWAAHSVPTTVIVLPQSLSCYWCKIVSLHMLPPTRVWPLRNREPPAKTCLPTYTCQVQFNVALSLCTCSTCLPPVLWSATSLNFRPNKLGAQVTYRFSFRATNPVSLHSRENVVRHTRYLKSGLWIWKVQCMNSLLTHGAINLFLWRCATEHSSSCL